DLHKSFAPIPAPSGNAELDEMVSGGLERVTNTLLIGAAGVGKSSLAITYALAATQRGEHAAIFAFDEGRITLQLRARNLGMPLEPALDNGLLHLRQIDPAELSPGEFSSLGRR